MQSLSSLSRAAVQRIKQGGQICLVKRREFFCAGLSGFPSFAGLGRIPDSLTLSSSFAISRDPIKASAFGIERREENAFMARSLVASEVTTSPLLLLPMPHTRVVLDLFVSCARESGKGHRGRKLIGVVSQITGRSFRLITQQIISPNPLSFGYPP